MSVRPGPRRGRGRVRRKQGARARERERERERERKREKEADAQRGHRGKDAEAGVDAHLGERVVDGAEPCVRIVFTCRQTGTTTNR